MSSCCVCLCVYNNQVGLPFVLNNIDRLRESKIFENLQVLVFYDTCKDSSLEILKNYMRTKDSSMIIYENPTSLIAPRTERIAYARNGLLNMIKERFSTYEYFAMMDSNHYSCIGKIRPQVLREMLIRSEEWDAITFDREDGYYDHWALSYDPYIYSFFHFEDWRDAVAKMRADFNQRMEFLRHTKPNELFRVYSAFNGFGLYKTTIFIECKYSSNINILAFPSGMVSKHAEVIGQNIKIMIDNDCEHRFFHLDGIRRKNARICISLLSLFERTNPKESSKKISSNTTTFLMNPKVSSSPPLKRSMEFHLKN